ncbi:MAG TPA: tetratricopeptide repeat protein, partial [Gammaproteobacteria bacterium]|nr:tetratricopeptide repeat protein [Gammaproteobacteria bacterium]
FGIAWDSRPRSAGGQRWFALYPGTGAAPSGALNWTAPDQTWNYQCAACHSTDLHKNYDLATHSYATTYSEVSVGCEACHGPGSAHVAWAKDPHHPPQLAATEGLTIALDERQGVTWKTDLATGLLKRSRPRTSDREIETCAECHARATQIHRDYVHGQPLGDDYRVALLDDDLYFPDGQIKGEVYEYGSFLQSRMFHAGVSCSDCHNPHTATLRAQGNRLCTGCHLADKYDSPRHYHHPVGSTGAQCVACHMPTRTYMRIDRRRDHSIRVPRPDFSVAIGTPNACNECHVHRSAQWAAEHITKWFGPRRIGFQRFAAALHAGEIGAPGSYRQLANLVASSAQPAIARATAITLLAAYGEPQTATLLQRESHDPSALVRRATAEALANANRAELTPFLRLLGDPVRSVRIAAADALAEIDRKALSAPTIDAFNKASAEYLAAQQLDADRPEAHLDLALYFSRQNRLDRAKSELATALALDPGFAPAAVNLADLYRSLGQDDRAGQVLQASLKRAPDNPALLFSLGLLDIRKGAKSPALEFLQEASRNAPDNARYAYVYALALEDAGNTETAIEVLEQSLQTNPYDRESLSALASFYTRIGNPAAAAKYQRVLARLTADP